MVIGLNLCPFARRVFDADLIRYVATDAADEETLLAALSRELTALASVPRRWSKQPFLFTPRRCRTSTTTTISLNRSIVSCTPSTYKV
nr:DUF1415 family protein [Fimbriiglobus ruber]